ncbi:uncharacterized protein TRIADDRAFT_59251 [Trichoplax adhaerens]|uniref:Glycolipid transfer protein domain-containing protein n=1 Tax=Trichoplax adhaerens TaxID=10228 RepID=B3S5A1_TRIAD|nr:hypothetical protein TRIADDRAFT_59251 [Trichoplax adhaerens]EDV22227.1 hypothetical protein TRIADDRAFT_59251 [Trichoplax adhaerens]|eukprot:XP_002115382.1 hypothetical protein TRIADDRAFT_59251 [Trichoplax adhaerens]
MDINGNISKLTKKFEQNREKYHTLQEIVRSEIAEKTTGVKNSATDALLWLKRALNFIAVLLDLLVKTTDEVSVCASTAYEQTLRRYHGFIVKGIFSLAVKASPYRKNFIKALGKDRSESETLEDLRKYTDLLLENVNTLNQFYQETGQERTDKV